MRALALDLFGYAARTWGPKSQHLGRLLPFLIWLPRVNRKSLRDDLLAALTGAIVVLPQGVAFATIAGMPPEYGLYAGMVPAIIAALFGSSWHLVSGPTTAASVVLFSSLSALAEPGSAEYVRLALTLTLMVGAIQLFMGFARLGTLVNFISHSVIVGFTAGAAVLIATSQIKHFLDCQSHAAAVRWRRCIPFWHTAVWSIHGSWPWDWSPSRPASVSDVTCRAFPT